MQSYVTSWSGAENGTNHALSQAKLNACFKSMNDMIDGFEPDETKQDYGELRLENVQYYYNYTKQFDAPSEELPIIDTIGNYAVVIGNLDAKGNFITTLPVLSRDSLSDYALTYVDTEAYRGPTQENPPMPSAEETIENEPINDTINDSGAVITDVGTKAIHTLITYYNLRLVIDTEPTEEHPQGTAHWEGTKQTREFIIRSYTRSLNLTDYVMNISTRYERKERS